MSQQFPEVTDRLKSFIEAQHVFFVGTAAREGKVNVSPKGLESLRVVGPNRIVWLNGTGSTNETAAHVLDSPRMTLMFCSFERKPLILKVYGTARVLHRDDEEWDDLLSLFPPLAGSRNVFDMTVEMAMTSCGFGVPLMEFQAERETLTDWATKKGEPALITYQEKKNQVSLDGFPTGLPVR